MSATPDNVSPATTGKPDHRIAHINPFGQRIWDEVSHSGLHSLWDFQGTPPKVIMQRTFKAFVDDNLVSRAAELGYYFLFALFPMLLGASSILGLAAARASSVYVGLLNYLAIVIPQSAFQMVVDTFNQTARAASGGKIVFGIAAALWSASVGFGAIQDTANIVYKVRETRPYWQAKLEAIGVTVLLTLIISLALATLFGADYVVRRVDLFQYSHYFVRTEIILLRIASWSLVTALLMLLFSVIYYFAPDVKNKHWHWLTPGAAVGIFCWLAASIGLRVYLHFFNSYSATYGSLGGVIILLTWFYVTGLMLLLGAEINSEIAAAVLEKKLKDEGTIPQHATTDPDHPIECGPAVA